MSGSNANLAFQQDRQDLSLDWINHPPVRLLDEGEVALCAGWLEQVITTMQKEPSTKDFEKRLQIGLERVQVLGCQGVETCGVYAYFYSGKPVGMMSIDLVESKKKKAVYIDSLVGHPCARNVGDILIEFAVNLSERLGFDGCVRLTAEAGAQRFYESVGFCPVKGGWNSLWTDCILKPQQPQWSKLSGQWHLTGLWQVRQDSEISLEPIGGTHFRN